jgi:2-phospho-L-lactate/phosphoenolpyruvate guanylyltransferase
VGTASWTVLVPLKSSRRGKSRIALDRALRRRLVTAMAADTVAAAAAASRVRLVVILAQDTGDKLAFDGLDRVVFRHTIADGLNTAILDGLTAVDGSAGVAVLLADLPSLDPTDLDDALRQAEILGAAVVPDRHGTGTTLLAARHPPGLRPAFGANSLAQHVADGARPLDLPASSGLRRDVDRAEDLRDVTGPRTRAVLDDTDRATEPA